jgi:XTP/dITP diphosphohydrolase
MRRFGGGKLLVATGNRGKLAEISALLAPFGVRVVSMADLGLTEPAETEPSFAGNARIKARAGAQASGLPTLADDSGLVIAALGGAPGIYTADWAETGQGRDFAVAMRKTWDLLEAVRAPEPRRALFCCTLVLAWPDGHEEMFEGAAPGRITWPMRGSLGHGYDPIFMPEGHDITFGEMAPELKNRLSHRADAFARLVEGCFT